MKEKTEALKPNRLIQITKLMFKDLFKAAPKEMLLIAVFIIVISLLPFGINLLETNIIDRVVSLITQSYTNTIPAGLFTILMLYAAAQLAENLVWSVISYLEKTQHYKLGEYFTLKFLQKASDLDLYHYEDSRAHDVIQKASESYSWRPQNLANRFIWTFGDLIRFVTSVTIVALFSWPFFILILLSTLPTLIVSIKSTHEVWDMWGTKAEVRRKFSESQHYLSDEHSLMELRIFRTKDYLMNIVKSLFTDFYISENKAARKKAVVESLTNVVSTMGIVAFWIYAMTQVLNGSITIGLFTFYASVATKFSQSLSALFRNMAHNYEDMKYMDDYYSFMSFENKIKSGSQRLEISEKPPAIEFRNVSFAYPGTTKKVIENFNLVIEPGQHVALVGENGAGKSTIIKLLSRFYDPTEGQILINGKDLATLEIDDWYQQIGVLFQNFVSYNFLPAKMSIGMGDIEKIENMEEIIIAAEKAEADPFIRKLQKGYDQILSKHFPEGVDLSGGQWQRIALARAFFRDAPILILDEPTSAIDAKTEYAIFNRLYEFAKDKTVIIISHRFSTVRQASHIYVVEEGQVIEGGSHEDLMKLEGKYHHAFSTQAKGYK